jgi:hypothetical protein
MGPILFKENFGCHLGYFLIAAFSMTRPVSDLVINVAIKDVEAGSAFFICKHFANFAG